MSWLWGRIQLGKKGKGEQYHLPYNTQAVGKNIKWGGRRKIWGRLSSYRGLYTPLILMYLL